MSTAAPKVAFLRAINVGGRRLKMDDLRRHFEDLGLSDVETFIASGNVIFTGGGSDSAKLERKIERGLEKALGFHNDAFVRTLPDLKKLVKKNPFPKTKETGGTGLQVGFLGKPVTAKVRNAVQGLSTEQDLVTVQGREVFWLPTAGVGRSTVGGGAIEKALGQPTTVRGIKTVEKILAKYER